MTLRYLQARISPQAYLHQHEAAEGGSTESCRAVAWSQARPLWHAEGCFKTVSSSKASA